MTIALCSSHEACSPPAGDPPARALLRPHPAGRLAQDVHLGIRQIEAALRDRLRHVLKPYGVSVAQYDVLCVLRDAGADGLCRNGIRDRLLTRLPDVTRLLDRMQEAGLVIRERRASDRRCVTTHLTTRGRELVEALDAPVAEERERSLGHLGEERLLALVRLLTLAR